MFFKKNPLQPIFLLAFLWGPSFLLIKYVVEEVPPLSFITLRFSLAVFLLGFILLLKKINLRQQLHLWKHAFMMGLLESTLPVILCAYSLSHIDSILSAIITGTSPVLTMLLAYFFLKDEPLTFRMIFGITLGLFGFLLLLFPEMVGNDFKADRLHVFLSFAASLAFASSIIYARKFIKVSPKPFVFPFIQLCSTLIYLIPLSLLFEPDFSILTISGKAWACLSGLAIFGTVLALFVYYHIVLQHGAIALSSVTYILPIFSTAYGVILLNEGLSAIFLSASTIILLGTFIATKNLQFSPDHNYDIIVINK